MERNTMITIREPLHLHLLWRHPPGNERVYQCCRVLEVHVIVSRTMLHQEASSNILKSVDLPHRRRSVASCVGRERAHVTLSVHGVVEAPVTHGGRDLSLSVNAGILESGRTYQAQ